MIPYRKPSGSGHAMHTIALNQLYGLISGIIDLLIAVLNIQSNLHQRTASLPLLIGVLIVIGNMLGVLIFLLLHLTNKTTKRISSTNGLLVAHLFLLSRRSISPKTPKRLAEAAYTFFNTGYRDASL